MSDSVVGQFDPTEETESTSGLTLEVSTDESSADEAVSVEASDDVTANPDEPQDEGMDDGETISPVQKLINSKYGGDENKFVAGIHEGWKSSAALRRELDEIKAQLRVAPKPEPEPEPEFIPPAQISEDLKWLGTELTSLAAEKTASDHRKNTILNEADGLDRAIARLEGKLEVVDDYEKVKVQQSLSELKAQKNGLVQEYRSLERRIKEIGWEERNFNGRKMEAERAISYYRDQAKQQRTHQEAKAKEIRSQFDSILAENVKQYSFADDPEFDINTLNRMIRGDISLMISSLPPNAPAVDIEAETSRRVADFAKLTRAAKKTTVKQLTNEKVEGATKVAPKGTSLPKPGDKSSKSGQPKAWSAEFAKARARKILGGGSA